MTTHPTTEIVTTALEIARTQLGVTEKAGNKGPEVKKYLASVGLPEGYAWCQAFVYWCFEQAALKMKVKNPAFKTAGVLAHWNKTTGLKVKRPRRGDIFIMDFGKGLGHTGFVDAVDCEGDYFYTVEGNSNSKLSRTGGMVCSNKRPISSCKGFIRY